MGGCMQVKLTMRSVPMPGGAPSVPKPFLTFTCRGPNLNMVQDLPISKPHMPARAAAPPAHVCPPSPAHGAVHHSWRACRHATLAHEACTVGARCLVVSCSLGQGMCEPECAWVAVQKLTAWWRTRTSRSCAPSMWTCRWKAPGFRCLHLCNQDSLEAVQFHILMADILSSASTPHFIFG